MVNILESLIKGTNSPIQGELVFRSNVHQRYENGEPVRGEQVGCHRDVKIEKNISGHEGYSVTIYNADAPNSFFGVTMGTKPMKIVDVSTDKVELEGFGYDMNALTMGVPRSDASFANYAMTVYFKGHNISHCTLHMLDRNVDIDYYVK